MIFVLGKIISYTIMGIYAINWNDIFFIFRFTDCSTDSAYDRILKAGRDKMVETGIFINRFQIKSQRKLFTRAKEMFGRGIVRMNFKNGKTSVKRNRDWVDVDSEEELLRIKNARNTY